MPVGMPSAGDTAATDAENVTLSPTIAGLSEVETVVVVPPCATSMVIGLLLLGLKLLSPAYVIVMVLMPAGKITLILPLPEEFTLSDPSVTPLSTKVSAPVGVPEAGESGATFPERVTVWPTAAELTEWRRPQWCPLDRR